MKNESVFFILHPYMCLVPLQDDEIYLSSRSDSLSGVAVSLCVLLVHTTLLCPACSISLIKR